MFKKYILHVPTYIIYMTEYKFVYLYVKIYIIKINRF